MFLKLLTSEKHQAIDAKKNRKKKKAPEVSLDDMIQEMEKDGHRFKKAETIKEKYKGPMSIR